MPVSAQWINASISTIQISQWKQLSILYIHFTSLLYFTQTLTLANKFHFHFSFDASFLFSHKALHSFLIWVPCTCTGIFSKHLHFNFISWSPNELYARFLWFGFIIRLHGYTGLNLSQFGLFYFISLRGWFKFTSIFILSIQYGFSLSIRPCKFQC